MPARKISPDRPQAGALEPARFIGARFQLRRLNWNGRATFKQPLHTDNRLQLNQFPVVLRGQLEPRHAASISLIPVEACRPHEKFENGFNTFLSEDLWNILTKCLVLCLVCSVTYLWRLIETLHFVQSDKRRHSEA